MLMRFVPYGRELALVIPQDLLDELGLTADAAFDLTTEGQHIVLTPVDDTERRAAFQAALKRRPTASTEMYSGAWRIPKGVLYASQTASRRRYSDADH